MRAYKADHKSRNIKYMMRAMIQKFTSKYIKYKQLQHIQLLTDNSEYKLIDKVSIKVHDLKEINLQREFDEGNECNSQNILCEPR